MGVTDARAESQCPHLVRVRHEFLDSLANSKRPYVIPGEHVIELARDVSSALETYRRKIRCVIHSEIVKRAEQSLVKGIPKPGLRGDAAVEPFQHRLAIGALGRSCEPEKSFRLQA